MNTIIGINFQKIREEIASVIQSSDNESEVHRSIFSKSGVLGKAKQYASSLPNEQKGSHFRELESMTMEAIQLMEVKFPKIEKQTLDSTVETIYELGKLHPITEEINLIRSAMERHGFQHVEGPIVDDEYYNFDALNVQKMHPARGEHDTFYLRSGQLLRTHCTNVEVRSLEENTEKSAKKMFHIGRVYRKDDDRTHSTMFHQVEGIYVDSFNLVTFSHLKWFLRNLVQDLLIDEVKLRFRPGYFPFTEPSVEVDILTEITETGSIRFVREGEKVKEGKWMEVLGAGMLCQNILRRAGYTEHTAFAFGLGIDRIVMLKHGISNINDLYKNRFPFLRMYGIEGGLE